MGGRQQHRPILQGRTRANQIHRCFVRGECRFPEATDGGGVGKRATSGTARQPGGLREDRDGIREHPGSEELRRLGVERNLSETYVVAPPEFALWHEAEPVTLGDAGPAPRFHDSLVGWRTPRLALVRKKYPGRRILTKRAEMLEQARAQREPLSMIV